MRQISCGGIIGGCDACRAGSFTRQRAIVGVVRPHTLTMMIIMEGLAALHGSVSRHATVVAYRVDR